MNKELLFQLYSIHSPSGREKKMRKFLKKIASEYGATSIEQDASGNLLITKGVSETYPCLAAHMDQVQENHSKDFMVFEHGDTVFAFSSKCGAQQGLGADDKNGIFICLECLRKYDVLKVAFFVGEETGCVGSNKVDLTFFKDCRFIVQPDRKGGKDLITEMFCGDVCSEDFVKAIGADKFGYKHDLGSITDVGELVERGVGISCLNLSCGYYNPHSDKEITSLSELENCLNFVQHIVETCVEVFPFEYVGYYGNYSSKCLGGYFFGKSGGKETEFDEYYEYFDGGFYDEDCDVMRDVLYWNQNVTIEEILQTRKSYYAYEFFDEDECINQLSEIYEMIKDEIWWRDDKDSSPQIKKVS